MKIILNGDVIAESKAENQEKAIIEAIAKEFSRGLLKELNEQFFEMVDDHIADNVHEEPYCITHSFCDSNVIMLDAFEKVLGVKWNRSPEHEEYFNQAWAMASANNFYHEELKAVCKVCAGTGSVTVPVKSKKGSYRQPIDCPECKG